MRDIKSIVKDVAEIYRESGNEAEEYLRKARMLKKRFGPRLAIIYCWFYSVPQRWAQVEPKIFELMKHTNSFDLDKILTIPAESLARMLKPMIFYNNISLQLKRFCEAIKSEYYSWSSFEKALTQESIFAIFKKLRSYKGSRITFKNLSAMKIFVGMEDNLLILDTHVGKVLGLNKNEAGKCRVQETRFKDLLKTSEEITGKLRMQGFNSMRMVKWSLAIWFNEAKIAANKLLSVY
jgi:endonuclease III